MREKRDTAVAGSVWADRRGPFRVLFAGRQAEPDRASTLRRAGAPDGVAVAWLRQVHSARVRPGRPGACGEGDALVTERAGLALSIATADCVPVLLAGRERMAAVHAGWRGIVAGVVGAAVGRIGEPPDSITAWIGPAIGACCYEVGEEVAEPVIAASVAEAVLRSPGRRPHLDLQLAVAAQLDRAGVERLRTVDVCTRCHPELLYSYRREGPGGGRNLSFIWKEGEP